MWKSPQSDFPTSLGNPAKGASFLLSNSYDDGGWTKQKTGHLTWYENRTFALANNSE
jgi:hypothetical protein